MERKIFLLPDIPIAFFICGVNCSDTYGVCTNYSMHEEKWKPKYYCNQDNVHFCCPYHPNVEVYEKTAGDEYDYSEQTNLWCDKCAQENKDYTGMKVNIKNLTRRAQILVNSEEFKTAKLIRIDEQCSEVKLQKLHKDKSGYFSAWGNIETDIKGNPQINLYIGDGGDKKVHYFIEPELSRIRYELSDKDIDPGRIIAKITLETRDNITIQEYKKEQRNEQ